MTEKGTANSKICKTCSVEKPLDAFRKATDGKYEWYERRCKLCASRLSTLRKGPEKCREEGRRNYARHREERNISDRRRYYDDPVRREFNIESARKRAATPKGRMQGTQRCKRWRAENPEKYKAQTAVGNAVRDGKLARGACVECGEAEMVVGHHHDYSKPLDVIWMCRTCHGVEHRIGAGA